MYMYAGGLYSHHGHGISRTGSASSPALPRILRFPGTGEPGMAPTGEVGGASREGSCSSSERPGGQRAAYEECNQAGPVKGLGR